MIYTAAKIETGTVYLGDLTITEDNAHEYAELTSVGGSLYVRAECSLPALTSVGGSLYMQAKVETPYGKLLCVSKYGLFRTAAGTYHAGCRQSLTAEQALAHWGGRTDERAKMFTAAINAAEAANQKDR